MIRESSPLLINLAFLIERPTGISVYAKSILPYLKPLQPRLLSAQPISDFKHHLIPNNLTPAQGAKGNFRRLVWTQFRLPAIYHQHHANLLFSPVSELPLGVSCRGVVMVHDLIPLRFPKMKPPLTYYYRFWLPFVLKQAEHIICQSITTARDISTTFAIPEQKITPIHLAYDAGNFRPLNEERQPYFLYLGRHDPHKNLSRILRALAQLPKRLELTLYCAGSPDNRYTPGIKALVAELGIAQRVEFLDYVPYAELPKLISAATALIFPSLWEGFGLPILEGMACGTPVITSNLGALAEVAGDAALLVDPYRVEAIAAAMQAVATDSTLQRQLQKAGIARSRQFSWEKTGKATAEVLQRFL